MDIVKQSIDRGRGVALATEFRFVSCQNYTDTHTNGEILNGRREWVFRAKSRKHKLLSARN